MLARIINETTDAVVAAVQGVDDILDAVNGTVKDQVINVIQTGGDIGGSTVLSLTPRVPEEKPPAQGQRSGLAFCQLFGLLLMLASLVSAAPRP